jgi:bifunctional non-homologous end joining protein LigD
VSVPLTWDELSTRIPSDHFTVQNIAKRLASLKSDPWAGIDSIRQGIAGALKKLRTVPQS